MTTIGVIIIFITLLIFISTLAIEKLREHIKLILAATMLFGAIGFGLLFYERLVDVSLPGGISLTTVVQKTVDDAKLVNEIRDTIVVQSKTIGLVVQQADEMKPEISRVAEEVRKFEAFLHETRNALQEEYKTISQELAFLKLQNDLLILRDKARSQGDKEALNQILRIAQTSPENSPIKTLAREYYIAVIRGLPSTYQGDPPLSVKLEDGTVKTDFEIPTAGLITSLSDADWNVRARAAMLLGGRGDKEVPDTLLEVISTDKDLRVIGSALISFGYITGKVKRPMAAGQEQISETQFIEMFEDIDKLRR